jgi:tetratricopeptide (TPR) repeat protein
MSRVLSLLLSVVMGGAAVAQVPSHPLLSAAPDPVAYLEARERVLGFTRDNQGTAAEVEALAERLVREYPLDGDNWFRLAEIKKALGRDAEAADAYERAGPLIGWGMTAAPRFLAAHRRVALGQRDEAIALIRQEVEESRTLLRYDMYEWPQFAALRDDPEFRELAGRPDVSGLSRDEGWRFDVDHLYNEILRADPDYHTAPPPAEFTRRYLALKAEVPALSDEAILTRMNHMLAALNHGHTWLWTMPPRHPGNLNLPVRFFLFPEGLFVVNATEAHGDLVGSKVLAIGDTPVADAMAAVKGLVSAESEMFRLYVAPTLLNQAIYLTGLGIIPAPDAPTTLTLEPAGGGEPILVQLTPSRGGGIESVNLLPPPRGVPTPLLLGNLKKNYWHEPMPARDAMYVQFNNLLEQQGETIREYGLRLRRDLAAAAPRNLILDLRNNTGGTTAYYTEFVRTVIGFSQQPEKKVYVLIGRATYSAAANLITDLESFADPVFVGEASSQCCSFAGDPTVFRLPYSRAGGFLSSVRWNLSRNVFDGRAEISPEVPVQMTAQAYFRGEDPALDTVFRLISLDRGVAPPPERPTP